MRKFTENAREIVIAFGWRPRIINGLWDGSRMWDRCNRPFILPPDFYAEARQLFAEGHWGQLRAAYPQWVASHTRPDHPDKSVKESRHYRKQIIRDQLMPFIDPDTYKWDGRTRIDTEGNVSVMPRGLRGQMQLMVLEGYYGNAPWDNRAMQNFGDEGRFRLQMLVSTIAVGLRLSGNRDQFDAGKNPDFQLSHFPAFVQSA